MTTFWDDFFREWYSNSTGSPYGNYRNHYIPPRNKGGIGQLAQTLREVKELIEALLENNLPTSKIISEEVKVDEDGLLNLEIVVEKEIGEKTRVFNIVVKELKEEEEQSEDEEPEDTTDYFTP
tara:strand:+ start:20014 stop:20382 length:369 start_codon:yes stop_codon:yes gene_type:complete